MGKNLSFVLNNLEDLVAAFFISITTILVVINIVLRYVFNSGLVWSEEVATGCFVWSVFIGAVAVFKHRGHVGVDIIVKRMPQGMQKAIGLITDVILVALNGYMSYLSIIYISKSYTKMTPVLGISSVYISSSVLIAFVLMTMYSIKFVWQDVTGSGKEENNGLFASHHRFVLYFPVFQSLMPCSVQRFPTLPFWMRLLLRIWYSNVLLPARSPSRCWQFPSLLWQAPS